MVVAPCHHPHEPGLGFQARGPAVGSESWEVGDDAVQPGGLGFVRGLADHQFRVGEAHGGDGGGVELAVFAGDHFRDHLALGHGAVGEHRFAAEVADGPDVAHAGLATVVDFDR